MRKKLYTKKKLKCVKLKFHFQKIMNFKIFNKYLNRNNKIMKIMKIKDITHDRIIFLQDIKLKIGLYIFNKNRPLIPMLKKNQVMCMKFSE